MPANKSATRNSSARSRGKVEASATNSPPVAAPGCETLVRRRRWRRTAPLQLRATQPGALAGAKAKAIAAAKIGLEHHGAAARESAGSLAHQCSDPHLEGHVGLNT